MDKMTVFTDELDGREFVIIDHGNDQFTSMLKSYYDAQVELSTENPTEDE